MMVGEHQVEALNVSQPHELAADALGLKLTLQAVPHSDHMLFDWTYAGIELFFHILALLEDYAYAPEADTYPPARARLAHIRATLHAWLDDEDALRRVTNIATSVESLVDMIRPEVLSEERRLRERARQPEFNAILHDLIESHAYLTGLRHVPFRRALANHEREFSPDVLCLGLATELRRAYVDCSAWRKADRRRAEARVELLTGLINTRTWLRAGVIRHIASGAARTRRMSRSSWNFATTVPV
jgi:hypothetical protein